MKNILAALSGGDLRSTGKSSDLISQVNTQKKFDELFKGLYNEDRIIVMRAADAIEKITSEKSAYLDKYKKNILELCDSARNKELKWHLALLLPRLNLSSQECLSAWRLLTGWALLKDESKIVRVNSIQALYEISLNYNVNLKKFLQLLNTLEKENIPSLTARIKKIKKRLSNSKMIPQVI